MALQEKENEDTIVSEIGEHCSRGHGEEGRLAEGGGKGLRLEVLEKLV